MAGQITFILSVLCILISFCFISCNNNLASAIDEKIEQKEGEIPIPGDDCYTNLLYKAPISLINGNPTSYDVENINTDTGGPTGICIDF